MLLASEGRLHEQIILITQRPLLLQLVMGEYYDQQVIIIPQRNRFESPLCAMHRTDGLEEAVPPKCFSADPPPNVPAVKASCAQGALVIRRFYRRLH